MQLQQAIQLVQAKFVAESQGNSEGEVHDKYHDAFDRFPLVMEVAVTAFSDELIQRNYEARKVAQAKAAAEGGELNRQNPQGENGEAS